MMMKRHVGKGVLASMVVGVIIHTMGYFTHPESSNINIDGGDTGVTVKSFENDMEDDEVFVLQVETNDNDDDDDDDNPSNGSSGRNSNSNSSQEERLNWWETYVEQVSVVYTPSNNTDWCGDGRPAPERSDNPIQSHGKNEHSLPKTGLYFVKTPKAGSSTAAAVSLQISEAVAAQRGTPTTTTTTTTTTRRSSCPHHVHHGIAYLRRREPYFLWTIVREPTKRTISNYFFTDVSRRHIEFNSTNLMLLLRNKRNFQLRYVGLQPGTSKTLYNVRTATQPQVVGMVQHIMNTYHFIAVVERMDESLVVMKLLYNFPDEAMVALSSKRAGGFDGGMYGRHCNKIQRAYTTPDVDDYIAGSRYRRGNYDYFLVAAVNRSLDKTIDMLGRDRVEREVKRHKELERLAEERCYDIAVFPCTKDGARPAKGAKQSCYFGDVGCGHECVMRVIREHVSSTQ
jgi:hypothetical protein